MVAITADNASNNTTLAKKVEELISGKFQASDHLMGCMAHVINLAARDGLAAFGLDSNFIETELPVNSMNIQNLVDPPDGLGVNLKTVISRIHGLSVYVRASPQRCEAFQSALRMHYKH